MRHPAFVDDSLIELSFIIKAPSGKDCDARVADVAASSGIALDRAKLENPEQRQSQEYCQLDCQLIESRSAGGHVWLIDRRMSLTDWPYLRWSGL